MGHQSPQSRRLTIIFELSNLKDKKRGNVLVKAIWKKTHTEDNSFMYL